MRAGPPPQRPAPRRAGPRPGDAPRPPPPAIAVVGTAVLALLLLFRRGRALVWASLDTAVATALVVMVGALVCAVPLLLLASVLAGGVTVLTWFFYVLWHVVETPVVRVLGLLGGSS